MVRVTHGRVRVRVVYEKASVARVLRNVLKLQRAVILPLRDVFDASRGCSVCIVCKWAPEEHLVRS
jgi:hypothetical protein